MSTHVIPRRAVPQFGDVDMTSDADLTTNSDVTATERAIWAAAR